jgi:chromosome segregation ATPase
VKKENFSLKLKIYFLEERLAKLAPDQIDHALKENIELKVDFQTLQQELKKHKRMCLNLNRALEALQADKEAAESALSSRSTSNTGDDAKRIRDLERDNERLRAERDSYRRGRAGSYDGEDARSEIARLRDELDAEREAREDALAQRDELRGRVDGHDGLRSSAGSRISRRAGGQGEDVERLQRRLLDLQQVRRLSPPGSVILRVRTAQDNASLSSQIGAQVTLLATRNAEKEQLYDEIENLKQDVQELEAELDVKAHASESQGGDASQRSAVEMQEVLSCRLSPLSGTV